MSNESENLAFRVRQVLGNRNDESKSVVQAVYAAICLLERERDELERRNGELEKDAARYQWLKGSVSERLTNNSLRNEFSEHKCEYIFPQLIAWADFCGSISFDDAIDMRIDEALTRTKEQK